MGIFLALLRLLSASLALWSKRFLAVKRVVECASVATPFARWLTALEIGVGELLPWCLEMRFLTYQLTKE
jgi:hypothetical protein